MHNRSVLGSLTALLLLSSGIQAGETVAGKTQVSKDADVSLSTQVRSALVESGIAKTGQIQVESNDGLVQLSGFVDSESTQELALRAARKVDGVESVRNDLVVRTETPTVSEDRDDAVIAAKVRKQLQQEPATRATANINVDVNEGVVQLSGFAPNVATKNRAADLVASVAGVKDVRNDIALDR